MSTSYVHSWSAYKKGFQLASRIFKVSHSFPKEERYSLTDQVRRSSRSVCANLAEGYAKRRYPKHFIAKLTDSAGENYETQTWLAFALDAGYVTTAVHEELTELSVEVGKLLTYMMNNPERF